MATLGKIRKHGWLLLVVIGIALLAFIVGDGIKAIRPTQNQRFVGEINGDKVSIQDYQEALDEYVNVVKFARGTSSLTDAQMSQIKDEVWNQMVTRKLIEDEVGKMGVTVTPAEIEAALDEGTHQLLTQSMFVNQQTGKFDKDLLYNFLNEYKEMDLNNTPAQYTEYYQNVYNYWKFLEKNLTHELLLNKYEALVANAQFSNPVAAQSLYEGRNNYCKLAYAVVPFTAVADSTVTVTDADIKVLYNKRKESYHQYAETRDLKYIDIAVVPSEEDRQAIQEEMNEITAQLAEATPENMASVVRLSESTVTYSEVPRTAASLPADIAERVAAAAIDAVEPVYYNEEDDSYNTFRLMAKTTGPDSIQYRQIQVAEEDPARTAELADSIFNALKQGADFAELAERYGQQAEPQWVASASYEGGAIMGDNATYINALNAMKAGEIKKLDFDGASLIVNVTGTKNPVEKYQVAVVKRPAYFSKETYNQAYNKLSQFVASNQTAEEFEANAEEAGFRLLPLTNMQNTAHNVGGVENTREALRWAFNAKVGDVSQIFEAGQNDHLLALCLDKVQPMGYIPFSEAKDMLRYEALNEKKAEKILADVKNVKTLAEASALENAKSDTLTRVTFSSPVFVSLVPASEPVLSGKAAGMEVGDFDGPIKGNGGIYFIQVVEKNQGAQTYDAEQEQKNAVATATRSLTTGRLVNELFSKSKVVDSRYRFF
ncbi:MAG: SurA N-terminal domain-containing protein [Bacteroidaceae bacterium]|nr:SurA N-terminal domain-containing protein [Bacteroidaceae bacterium]